MMFRNAQSTSNVIFLALAFVFVSIFLFDSVSSSTEPFTITENTIYGFSENTVIVTITENLGKDQNVDISNLFIDHPLTDALEYSPILLNQSYSSDVYDFIDVSLGKYKTIDTIYWYDNDSVEHSRIVYLDDFGSEMLCDYVLGDKSCMSEEWDVIGSETLYDFRPLPTIKEKIVVDGLKIEQKESGIPLPKNSVIQVKYFVKHPIPYGSDYSVRDVAYNKYDIKVCSEDGTECTILDPDWYSESWGFRRNITINSSTTLTDYQVAVNITYDSDMLSNFSDGRFTDENNVSMSYWLENKSDGEWAYYWVKTNLTTANETQLMYYYGNPTAESESNGTATMIGFEDGVTNNLERTTYGTGSWSIVSGQRHGVSTTTAGGYLMGLYDIPTSFYTETDVTQTADSSDSSNAYSLGLIDDSTFTTSETDAVFNPKKRFIITRYSPTYSQPNKFLVYYIDSSDTPHYWTGSAWGSATFVGSSGTYKTKMWADETNFYADILDSTGTSLFTSPASITKSSVKSFTNEYTMVSGDPYNNYYYLGMNYDNYILRQYTATEPTYSIGEEETYNVAPNVTIISPENITYGTTSIALNWYANELLYSAWYSLNGGANNSLFGWALDNSIVSGLPTTGTRFEPETFFKDGTWYIISGNTGGTFTGFNWTGSAWQSDTEIVSGLTDVGAQSTPSVFQKDSTWYLISGNAGATFIGFNWTGSTWQSDSAIISGLGDIGTTSSPNIFEKNSTFYLISGLDNGTFTGFNWTGSAWQSDTEIVSGLTDVGAYSSPDIFEMNNILYLISGDQLGTFTRWQWNGTLWISDADSFINGSDIGENSVPTIFQKDDVWHLITGAYFDDYIGFIRINMNTTITAIGGSNNITVYANDTLGAIGSATEYFYVDIYAPTVDAYYQWNSTNGTVDFGIWTDGFVSINWNLTDTTGINTSSCSIKVRNKNHVTNNTNHSYIDDNIHPDYDNLTGYKDLICYTEDLGGGVTRVSANMTRNYDWRPLNTAFEQDNASHDNIYYSHGGRSTKIIFHNVTDLINTTFIFLADVVNQINTVADMDFYACNSSYTLGEFTASPYCALVGSATPDSVRDINFNYLIGALETDENGTYGGVKLTETMYGMSYCPACTNTGNAWITYSTNGYDGHSATSPNQGATWTDLTGEEFNVILHVIDNTQLEFNLTINDTLGNQLSDLQIDEYGIPGNKKPFGDIMKDNVTGGLISYYDIHGVAETGTIWINVTVYDPNGDVMNCSIYLLNNDSSVNQTLLSNYSVSGYGICPYEWNTTAFPDGDYKLNATATDGLLTGYDETAGFIRIDNTAPTINISSPLNVTYNATIDLNVSADELIAEWYYSIDYSDWALFTPNTTLIGFEINDVYLLDILAIDFAGLNDTQSVYFTINFTGGAYLRDLTCSSSDMHYISLNPLDDDDLRWSCELDTTEIFYCMTHVYGNDEFNNKDEDKLLQTNPKRTTIKRYGIVDYFKSTGSYANVYFTDEKLMSESNYTYEVECVSSSGLYYGAFNKSVSIEYRKIANSMAFGVWSIDNMGYLLGVFFLIVILIILLSMGLKRR